MGNYVSGSHLSYPDYLLAKSFVDDLTSSASQSSQRVSMTISREARELIASQEALSRENIRFVETQTREMITSHEALSREHMEQTRELFSEHKALERENIQTLNSGFEQLSYDLGEIRASISELNATFHWGFGAVLASLGHMNDSLSELVKIAKTPVQTVAFNHFEIARDAFRQGLFQECLDELEKSISGDHTSSGYKLEWRFHQMKGTVYLGFVNGDLSLVNLDKAEESFLLAARYAKTDYPEDSARAFLSAGWAAYCQGKMKEALAHTEMAMTLHPQMGEAFFQAAKVLMATNQVNLALPVIRKAIDLDRFYIFKAAGDGDFQKHNDTFCHFLNDLRAEKYNQILPVTQELAGQLDFYRQNSPEALHDQRLQQMDLFLDTGHNWALYDLVDFSSVLEQFRTELEKKRIWLNEDVVHTLYEEDPVNEVYRAEVKYQVEEVYQEEKTYQERVIIKPAGLWRAAVTELQTKTHMVDKTRLVSKTNWVEKTRIVMKTVEFYVGERIEKEYNGLGVLINSKSYMDNPNRVKSYVDHYNQDFVLIKAGSFSRGVGSNAKSFTVYQDFYIAQYPVTQKLWQQVMGDNPSKNKRDENCPVEQVSWYDAQSFIKKLNDQAGQNVYRLPTAREWEYACRAGSNGNYCFGDKESELGQYAWYDKNSGGRTHPVAQKKPNAWGLYDMHGNVQEWCKNEFYEPSILRGGGWNTTAYSCSFDNNSNTNILLNIRSDDFGFRLVRSE